MVAVKTWQLIEQFCEQFPNVMFLFLFKNLFFLAISVQKDVCCSVNSVQTKAISVILRILLKRFD